MWSLRREPSREPAVEGPLVVTVQVAPVAHVEEVAVILVIPDPVDHTAVFLPLATLNPAEYVRQVH